MGRIVAAETERLRLCFAELEIGFKREQGSPPLSQKKLPELEASYTHPPHLHSSTLSPPLHRLAILPA